MIPAKKIVMLAMLVVATGLSSCRTHKPHNPFLSYKVKPSQEQRKDDQKHIKRGSRAYKKQMQSNRKHLFGRKVAPKA